MITAGFNVQPRYAPPPLGNDHAVLIGQVGDFDVYRSERFGVVTKHGQHDGEWVASHDGRVLSLDVPSLALIALFVATGPLDPRADLLGAVLSHGAHG